MRTTIGDKSHFAIDYEITQYAPYFMGKFCIWIEGNYLGFYEDEVFLYYLSGTLDDLLNESLSEEPLFEGKSDKEIFKVLLNDRDTYDKYMLRGFGESFDDFNIWVIKQGDRFKFLWKISRKPYFTYPGYKPGKLYSGYVEEGYLREVLKEYNKIFPLKTNGK